LLLYFVTSESKEASSSEFCSLILFSVFCFAERNRLDLDEMDVDVDDDPSPEVCDLKPCHKLLLQIKHIFKNRSTYKPINILRSLASILVFKGTSHPFDQLFLYACMCSFCNFQYEINRKFYENRIKNENSRSCVLL